MILTQQEKLDLELLKAVRSNESCQTFLALYFGANPNVIYVNRQDEKFTLLDLTGNFLGRGLLVAGGGKPFKHLRGDESLDPKMILKDNLLYRFRLIATDLMDITAYGMLHNFHIDKKSKGRDSWNNDWRLRSLYVDFEDSIMTPFYRFYGNMTSGDKNKLWEHRRLKND